MKELTAHDRYQERQRIAEEQHIQRAIQKAVQAEREALEAAKRSQEQISGLSALCETLNKLQETAVQMIQPAVEAAVHKEREACARIIDGMADDMEREMESSYAISWVRSKAAEIRARGNT